MADSEGLQNFPRGSTAGEQSHAHVNTKWSFPIWMPLSRAQKREQEDHALSGRLQHEEIELAQSTGHELTSRRSNAALAERRWEDVEIADGAVQQEDYPRVDGGMQAWLFLAGCFCVEALVWGFPFSFGVFQDYYSTHEPFSKDPSRIAIIGTSASGIMYLSGPFIFAAMQRWPSLRRNSSSVGLAIISFALVLSSFSQTVTHLILTQGVLYAIGGSFLYAPAIFFLDEWFVVRKGFAYGVMWAGTGTSGLLVPLIMNWGLGKYGFRTMLRCWAVTMVILSAPLIYFIKPRLPPSGRANIKMRFLKTPAFWFLQIGNIIQGLGFFIPTIYLPTYARSLNLSHTESTLTISLLNITSVLGSITMGALSDKIHVTSVILISSIGASLAVFLFWGFALSLPLLCVFSLLYGFFAGGFSSTYTMTMVEIKRAAPGTETGILFGLLAAGRGIGNVICGPLSEAMLASRPWIGEAKGAYGTGYGALIVFTGITAAVTSVSYVAKKMKML